MFSTTNALSLTATIVLGSSFMIPNILLTPSPAVPFDEATIYLEYNATDEDAEVVVSVDADVGLEHFQIVNPRGQQILNMRARHNEHVCIRKINLETPGPSLAVVLESYPAGWYEFFGQTTTGESLFSLVWLSHELPDAPRITFPLDGAVDVPLNGASATWTAGPDAESFFLELEQDDLGVDVKSNIAGGASSFGFPAGWLAPDTEYQLGVAARADNGNLSVVELHFTTGS